MNAPLPKGELEMAVTLSLREEIRQIPLEADCITPDLFAQKSQGEIEALPVYYGNEQHPLGDFFKVEGERSEEIRIEGDCARVKRIGQGMTRGKIRLLGNAGMHLGALMQGGEILVEGNADDWAGAEMEGGLIRIKGNAGNRAGAAYRGSKFGMRGGVIIVEGNAGHEVGGYMRRGLIVVGGDAQDFLGARMVAGTIFVFGRTGLRCGGGMKRGTIVSFHPVELLPTFKYDATYEPVFLRIFFKALKRLGIEPPPVGGGGGGRYRRYHGDLAELGKGEILILGG